MAFNKLRDFFSLRARLTHENALEEKRQKALAKLSKWDDYRVRKEQVMLGLYMYKRR